MPYDTKDPNREHGFGNHPYERFTHGTTFSSSSSRGLGVFVIWERDAVASSTVITTLIVVFSFIPVTAVKSCPCKGLSKRNSGLRPF